MDHLINFFSLFRSWLKRKLKRRYIVAILAFLGFCNIYMLRFVVVVVYHCSISNVMISVGIMKHFCIARFTLCQNVKNTPAASQNLSNCYPGSGMWQVHTHYDIQHINPIITSLFIGRRNESVLRVQISIGAV